MEDLIKQVLSRIIIEQNSFSGKSLSLYSGRTGSALFKLFYYKFLNFEEVPEILQNDIQIIAENSFSFSNYTFCEGLSGINWFFNILYQNNILSLKDYDILNQNVDVLAESALLQLSNGKYDFLHGSLGIAFYILSSKSNPTGFYEKYFALLNMLMNKSHKMRMIPFHDFANNSIKTNHINLGLAHGLPSILKFCLQCFKQNICKREAELLARNIITFLVNHKNIDSTNNFFPHEIIDNGVSNKAFSRLAWCYGDLGIAFILFEAGSILNDKSTFELAIQILKSSTKRRNFESTQVVDAGICHGTAGIGHIYNKLWLKTGDIIFKEACDYWITQTLLLSEKQEGISIYKKYDSRINAFVHDSGFLEGSAGIGLVLLSYLNHDFEWDSCIMLNN